MVRIGFADLTNNQVVDAAAALPIAGIHDSLPRAVDILRLNTETAGQVSRAIGDAAAIDAPRWGLDDITYLPCVEAGSLRDFIAFEEHIGNTRRNRGAEIPPAWYELPAYYKGNYRSLIGHLQPVKWPRYTERLDYELEVACVVGKQGTDILAADAWDYIGGYAIMNDWSARDIQFQEGSIGLGPAKGKDFGTSVGPWLVTPDEFDPTDARMVARINGEIWSDGNLGNIHWSFARMVEHASNEEVIYPGDILGSGTVGNGCGAEHGRWLSPGDDVVLEVSGLGALRNVVYRP
jgi:2-keto-4-pentenoate hydratase/2-oxohepta-3-ene-1,7-dioic acid hydratase in catechol pathway